METKLGKYTYGYRLKPPGAHWQAGLECARQLAARRRGGSHFRLTPVSSILQLCRDSDVDRRGLLVGYLSQSRLQ